MQQTTFWGLKLLSLKYGIFKMNRHTIKLPVNIVRFIAFASLIFLIVSCDKANQIEEVDLTDLISNETLKASNKSSATDNTLIFGFDLRNSPSEDAKQYLPFLNYLKQATNLDFELKFTAKGSDIATELGEGRIHLAAIGATSYIKAREKFGVIALTRGINKEGKAKYRSTIVVHPSSKLKKLQGLRGKRFAFGSIDSTQGHLIPRIELGNHNIYFEDLGSYQYTGSHLNCANAVISNQVDACGMQDTLANELASKGLLRILYKSAYYPSSGIAANQNVSKEILDTIRQAMLAFKPKSKHKEQLYNWEKTEMPNGFIRANPLDYTELRKWMIEFKLLTEAG